MATVKETFKFTEEDITTCLALLPMYEEYLTTSGDDDNAEVIRKLQLYLTNLNRNRARHYCCLCKAKRNEVDMHELRNRKPGRAQWQCDDCGDSRFKEVEERTAGKDGTGSMRFKLRGSSRK